MPRPIQDLLEREDASQQDFNIHQNIETQYATFNLFTSAIQDDQKECITTRKVELSLPSIPKKE